MAGSNETIQALETIHRLRTQIENESDFTSEEKTDNKLESSIQKLTQKGQLGSTILV
ncbi:12000_t:CDS:2, partial [Funneliformis caledonium]